MGPCPARKKRHPFTRTPSAVGRDRVRLEYSGAPVHRQLNASIPNISVGSLWAKSRSCPDTGGSWEHLKVASWSRRCGPWTLFGARDIGVLHSGPPALARGTRTTYNRLDSPCNPILLCFNVSMKKLLQTLFLITLLSGCESRLDRRCRTPR